MRAPPIEDATMTEPQPGQPAPPLPPPAGDPGSLGAGIALAWACLIGGYIIAVPLVSTIVVGLNRSGGDPVAFALLIALLPWVAMIGLAIYFSKTNRPRTAKGVLVGIASILGVGLLLAAACFGILSTMSFH